MPVSVPGYRVLTTGSGSTTGSGRSIPRELRRHWRVESDGRHPLRQREIDLRRRRLPPPGAQQLEGESGTMLGVRAAHERVVAPRAPDLDDAPVLEAISGRARFGEHAM